ncbi:GMC family oxidoreductase N-terminal domain-containing protein [Phaeobacter sp. CNT1-3]|nr:GMC family oxidoreductase N-terminal domain-containing protein [Phaeobacter sp. CNT1-3]
MTERFDYVIIGAGSAGCVLADRLSASGRHRILVLERGPRGRSPWITMPAGYGKLFYHPRLNYGLKAEPDAALNGRADYWPRGRVVGGSGAINAMVYCRGLKQDFDDWADRAGPDWGWDAVRAVYERTETHHHADGTVTGAGPLHITATGKRIHKVNRHFFAALEQQQLPRTEDMNGPRPEGGSAYPVNIKSGRRWAAAQAYLKPALRRHNVVLRADAQVQRITFDGKRATGVIYQRRGQEVQVEAGQVILSAGAVHSPQILQLSGLGPADLLQEHGIEVLHANDNIGGNLQDHLGINYYFRATERTLNSDLGPWWGKAWAGLCYVLARRGPLALSVNQAGGFFRSGDAPDGGVDQQLYFNPVTYTTTQSGTRNVIHPDPFPGFILGMQPTRPTSRGRIDIASAEVGAAPRIHANPLATEADQQAVIAGGRLCQRILAAPALQQLIDYPMYGDLQQMTDGDILADFRDRCGSVFHPVSTCRMGTDPATSVLTPDLRVRGVEGLRVVDASAFPNITSGNTNAPTMMLAQRAADLILKEA